jgi:hypothetical protein
MPTTRGGMQFFWHNYNLDLRCADWGDFGRFAPLGSHGTFFSLRRGACSSALTHCDGAWEEASVPVFYSAFHFSLERSLL